MCVHISGISVLVVIDSHTWHNYIPASIVSQLISLVPNKLRTSIAHTWLIASLTLVAHTALVDDDFREVPVYLMPAMVSVAMQTRSYRLSHRSPHFTFSPKDNILRDTRRCAVKTERSSPRRGLDLTALAPAVWYALRTFGESENITNKNVGE